MLIASSANATETGGKVKGFYINNTGLVLLKLDQPIQPACGDSVWNFQFSVNGTASKEWITMLLTAKATNTVINLGYIPNPNGRCSVSYFYYY